MKTGLTNIYLAVIDAHSKRMSQQDLLAASKLRSIQGALKEAIGCEDTSDVMRVELQGLMANLLQTQDKVKKATDASSITRTEFSEIVVGKAQEYKAWMEAYVQGGNTDVRDLMVRLSNPQRHNHMPEAQGILRGLVEAGHNIALVESTSESTTAIMPHTLAPLVKEALQELENKIITRCNFILTATTVKGDGVEDVKASILNNPEDFSVEELAMGENYLVAHINAHLLCKHFNIAFTEGVQLALESMCGYQKENYYSTNVVASPYVYLEDHLEALNIAKGSEIRFNVVHDLTAPKKAV